jgi:hypothetical protein
MTHVAITIGDTITHATTHIAAIAAVIGQTTNANNQIAVVNATIHQTTMVMAENSFGFSSIQFFIGVIIFVNISYNNPITGISALPIVCFNCKNAASCIATFHAYVSDNLAASHT